MAENDENIVPIGQDTFDELSEKINKGIDERKELKKVIEEVRKENRQIIIGVVIAFFLVIGAIIVEIMIFHASPPCY